MTLDEYKLARDRSGISVLDIWCRTIGISGDTHKSINSGRMAVSDAVASRIDSYFSGVEARATTLRDALAKPLSVAFSESSVELDPHTFDINLTLPESRRIKVEHCGVDTMNGWGVYNVNFGHGKEPLLLLHARVPLWKGKPETFQWYMWRGPFSGMQSYWNELNEKMLAECFKQ